MPCVVLLILSLPDSAYLYRWDEFVELVPDDVEFSAENEETKPDCRRGFAEKENLNVEPDSGVIATSGH